MSNDARNAHATPRSPLSFLLIRAHSFGMLFRATGGRCSSRCRVGRLHDKRLRFMRNLDARGVVIVVDMLGMRRACGSEFSGSHAPLSQIPRSAGTTTQAVVGGTIGPSHGSGFEILTCWTGKWLTRGIGNANLDPSPSRVAMYSTCNGGSRARTSTRRARYHSHSTILARAKHSSPTRSSPRARARSAASC